MVACGGTRNVARTCRVLGLCSYISGRNPPEKSSSESLLRFRDGPNHFGTGLAPRWHRSGIAGPSARHRCPLRGSPDVTMAGKEDRGVIVPGDSVICVWISHLDDASSSQGGVPRQTPGGRAASGSPASAALWETPRPATAQSKPGLANVSSARPDQLGSRSLARKCVLCLSRGKDWRASEVNHTSKVAMNPGEQNVRKGC